MLWFGGGGLVSVFSSLPMWQSAKMLQRFLVGMLGIFVSIPLISFAGPESEKEVNLLLTVMVL